MRIVSGKYRRRLLLTNPGNTTRPITDRAKVILFDRLQPFLGTGPRVADVFAGTGTMGLEALSRGAKSCVFFEFDRKAHELLVKNVEMLGADVDSVCWRTDVFRTSFKPKTELDCLPYDLVFFDPPYKLTPDIRPGSLLYFALERLGRSTVTADNGLLILRCDEHAEFELPPCWTPDQTLRVNSMLLYFYRCRRTGVEAEDMSSTDDVPTDTASEVLDEFEFLP